MTADTAFSQGSVLKKVDRLITCGSIEPGTIATVCSAKYVRLFCQFRSENSPLISELAPSHRFVVRAIHPTEMKEMSADTGPAGSDTLIRNLRCFSWGWEKAKKQHHLAVKGMIPWQNSLVFPPEIRNEQEVAKTTGGAKVPT